MRPQHHQCPSWCVAVHDIEDEAGEHRHRSAIVDVAALTPGGATTLLLEVHRAGRDPTTYIYVGDGERQYLELSVESAMRVARAIENAGV